MEFESFTHALHYAKGHALDIVVVHGDVIDITKFKHTHPGGEESINQYIGTDVSELYDEIKSHKTMTAIKELQHFKIGYIKTDKTNKIIHNDVQEFDIPYPIDLQKGTVWQVFRKLSKTEYLAFIHDPKHMIDPPEAIMFDTKALEIFTKTPWFVIPLIWVPVVLYCIYYSRMVSQVGWAQFAVCFPFGILLWTLIEYCLHRFVFHLDENLPDYGIAILLHYLLHGIHHAFPMDPQRLVFPPILAIPIAYSFKVSFEFLFDEFAIAFLAGTLTGYILYDMSHYFLHHVTPSTAFYKFLKKYHILHHYKSPELGFGVSQYLWDWVFDTMIYKDDLTPSNKKINN